METTRRGEIAGIICLIALIASFITSFLFGIGTSATGDIVAMVIYLVICVTYFALLLAVSEIVKSTGDTIFIHRMRDLFVVMVGSCLFFTPLMAPFLVPDSIEAIVGVLAIGLLAILGVVSIRIAPFFNKLDGSRAEYGKKAAKWLKVSGWLMATVLLGIIGVLVSLIADYYLWRLVKQGRLETPK